MNGTSDNPTKIWNWLGHVEAGEEFHLISTSRSLLDRSFINTAFASEEMAWAKPLSTDQLETMLQQSQTLGLYQVLKPNVAFDTESAAAQLKPEDVKQIGMARHVTDFVTTVYLSDVYVLPEYRGAGFGKWLIRCSNEVVRSMPGLRRIMLHVVKEPGKNFYARELGVYDVEEERSFVTVMTRRTHNT